MVSNRGYIGNIGRLGSVKFLSDYEDYDKTQTGGNTNEHTRI